MKTKTYEVKTYHVHAYCDCGGEFELSPQVFTLSQFIGGEPKYAHRCNKCKKEEFFSTVYPDVREEEVEVDAEVN